MAIVGSTHISLVARQTFAQQTPRGRYVTNTAEYDFWTPQSELTGGSARVAEQAQSNVVPVANKMTTLKAGDSVVTGVDAVDAWGHTFGQTAFDIESEGKRLLFIADACNH